MFISFLKVVKNCSFESFYWNEKISWHQLYVNPFLWNRLRTATPWIRLLNFNFKLFHFRTLRTCDSAKRRWETRMSRPIPVYYTSPFSPCAACSAWPPGRSCTSESISSPRNWSNNLEACEDKKWLWTKKRFPSFCLLCWRSFQFDFSKSVAFVGTVGESEMLNARIGGQIINVNIRNEAYLNT